MFVKINRIYCAFFLILAPNHNKTTMEPNEITRLYTSSDVYMTETARTIQALLVSDLIKFTNFDSTITAAFATQFLAAVVAAETVVADTAVIDQQVQKRSSPWRLWKKPNPNMPM